MKSVKIIVGRSLGTAILVLCAVSYIPVALLAVVALLAAALFNALVSVFERILVFVAALMGGQTTFNKPKYLCLYMDTQERSIKKVIRSVYSRRVGMSWRRNPPYDELDRYDGYY